VRQILSHAGRVAERSLPGDSDAVRKLCGDITAMTDALCELRQEGKGATPQVCVTKIIPSIKGHGWYMLYIDIQIQTGMWGWLTIHWYTIFHVILSSVGNFIHKYVTETNIYFHLYFNNFS
jgi:hypothetical protein